MRFLRWVSEWVETIRVAPPFSRRRRDLLATLGEFDEADYVEAPRPDSEDEA